MMLPNTLSFRLTLWYLVAFVVSLLLAFSIFFLSLNSVFEKYFRDELIDDIVEFSELYQQRGLDAVRDELDEEMADEESNTFFVRIVDSDGALVVSSDLAEWQRLAPIDAASIHAWSQDHPRLTSVAKDADFDAYLTAEMALGDQHFIQTGVTVVHDDSLKEILVRALLWVILILIPVALLMGWLLSRRAVRGINQIRATTQKVEAGHLDQRVEVGVQGSEIQSLAWSFNAMLDRIQLLITDMRELTDNIAHDLRSPLTRIRANSEQASDSRVDEVDRQKASAAAVQDCDALMSMINTMLDVAEAESGATRLANVELGLSELVKDISDLFEPAAEMKRIRFYSHVEPDLLIVGDADRLRRMISNVLDNAIKYTPAGGSVSIGAKNDAENVSIEIRDTGCGVPSSDQSKIFDRFFRCDQGRNEEGTGLGLTYSLAIARAHGGDIKVASKPGEGSRFVISIPRLDQAVALSSSLPVGNVPIMSP